MMLTFKKQTILKIGFGNKFNNSKNADRIVKKKALIDNKEDYTVFHFCKTNKIQNLHDIEDHLEITNNMKVWQNRYDYFLVNGLDYDKVVKYYDIVKKLNNTYHKDEPKKSFLIGIHFKLLYWISRIIVSFVSIIN